MLQPPGSSKREPVMLMLGSKALKYSKHKKYRRKYRVVDEFIKFLATPKAAAAMAKHNVYIKGTSPKTTRPPVGKPEPNRSAPVKKNGLNVYDK
ncbi:MAG: hypothetical protein K8S55_02865 [Phycisphaerae bacterium]|nr:hypothetical protein [Phycisphaerae bacterium]